MGGEARGTCSTDRRPADARSISSLAVVVHPHPCRIIVRRLLASRCRPPPPLPRATTSPPKSSPPPPPRPLSSRRPPPALAAAQNAVVDPTDRSLRVPRAILVCPKPAILLVASPVPPPAAPSSGAPSTPSTPDNNAGRTSRQPATPRPPVVSFAGCQLLVPLPNDFAPPPRPLLRLPRVRPHRPRRPCDSTSAPSPAPGRGGGRRFVRPSSRGRRNRRPPPPPPPLEVVVDRLAANQAEGDMAVIVGG